MNMFFINIFENMKMNGLCSDDFSLNESEKDLVNSWYSKYSDGRFASDKTLLELMYYYYIHENIDVYNNEQFYNVSKYLNEKYGIKSNEILKMKAELFNEILFIE